ncbi:MAG: 16S rRNA (cytosine(967)-C(5))-methyltransferase RsmB [Gallicola sp.]|nr:16S rRNA (cytosine(967)-C(5))-methyltransferase RsmB [Gallicola sp.]
MKEREIAFEILMKTHYENGFASDLLKNLEVSGDHQKEIGFVKRLVYGVLEEQKALDYFIREYSSIPIEKIDREILEILRISIYQYLFLDKVPEYAIVNEAQELTQKYSKDQSKSFVNGLLRNIIRDEISKSDIRLKNKWTRLEVEYSVSKDLLDFLRKNYSDKTIKKILKSYNYSSDTMIRINRSKISKEELMKSLREEGFLIREHEEIDSVLIIENSFALTKTDAFQKGYFTIQDASSVLSAFFANPGKDMKVLDLCAAPGSKTCQMAEIMENTGSITANDVYKNKLHFIEENAKRMGASNISTTSWDGTIFKAEWEKNFDLVLLDAPCSGTGIIAKKPEIKLRRSKEEIENLMERQRLLIDQAVKYVKKGGYLLYSTCSILSGENEDQRDYILKHYNVEAQPLFYKGGERDYLKIMPYEKDQDGFFIAKFRKL